jgi:hypothetical protein
MRRRWVLFAFVFVFAISALTILIGYSLLPISEQDLAQPWIFKGAYATYTGQVADVSTQTHLSARIEVTDVNFTHVQVKTSSTIAPPSGPPVNDHFALWISKANISFQPPGEAFAGSYSGKIANRLCTVYVYTNEAINATYYMDNALQWPVRLLYVTGFENQTYTLEFNLNSTNIGALDEAFLK